MIKKRLLAPVLIMLMLCMLSGCFFSLPLDHMDKIEGDITCAFRAGEDASHWQETVNTDAVFDKDRFVELFNEFNKYDPAFYKDHLDKLDLRIVREDQFDEYEEMAASEVNFMAYFTDKNGNEVCRNVSVFRYESKMYFFILCMGGGRNPEHKGYYYKEVPADMVSYWEPIYEKVLADKAADRKAQYGSFTVDKTFSFDNQYYAKCMPLSTDMMEIEIFDRDEDLICAFQPCRTWDFWGICWEKDTYNIWVQSSDIGCVCYKKIGNEWVEDKTAVKPDYITGRHG